MTSASPFLKWVGGKAKLAQTIADYFPRRIDTYYEPFLGGGAVFWHLAANKRFKAAILNDVNKELIDCYRTVRDFPDDLIRALKDAEGCYNQSPKDTFEHWKAQSPSSLDPVMRAVRTILLNKTGFNGLFRVNLQGRFNVPWGKRDKARLFDEENLRACAAVLNNRVSLKSVDFVEATQDAVNENDVIYFDPPYVPVSKTSSFVSYTDGRFTLNDHYRLLALFKDLSEKGVKVVLSNADVSEVRAMYEGFELQEVKMARAINSNGKKRGPVGELLVFGRRAAVNSWVSPSSTQVCRTCGHTPGPRCPIKCDENH